MKRFFFVILVLAILLIGGCRMDDEQQQPNASYTFTDSLNRTVRVDSLDRVAIASGSLADCWLLAGGTVCAVTRDAIEERNLELPDDVIDLGSLKNPNAELLLSSGLDLVILMPSYSAHLALAELLDKAKIPYAYFDVETFDDYLGLLKTFTTLTGRPDLYETNGAAILTQVNASIEQMKSVLPPNVLLLRTSSSNIKSLGSDTMVGHMLKDLGCQNIADSDTHLLTELSLEGIISADPDYIFVICMGDTKEAVAHFNYTLSSNPIWSTLTAVKENRFHFLPKELFHYKPNARWGESYETLVDLLTKE